MEVGFDSTVYSVSEGIGNATVSVRRLENSVVDLGRPIVVRVSSMAGNATSKYSIDEVTVISSQLQYNYIISLLI